MEGLGTADAASPTWRKTPPKPLAQRPQHGDTDKDLTRQGHLQLAGRSFASQAGSAPCDEYQIARRSQHGVEFRAERDSRRLPRAPALRRPWPAARRLLLPERPNPLQIVAVALNQLNQPAPATGVKIRDGCTPPLTPPRRWLSGKGNIALLPFACLAAMTRDNGKSIRCYARLPCRLQICAIGPGTQRVTPDCQPQFVTTTMPDKPPSPTSAPAHQTCFGRVAVRSSSPPAMSER